MPQVEIPQWAQTRGGGAIYSVDITSEYFCTASGDGKVRIWDAKAVKFENTGKITDWKTCVYERKVQEYPVVSSSSSDEEKEKTNKRSITFDGVGAGKQEGVKDPRLIASLASHEGSVLAVKFSNNRKYLASAGDDGSVCIYTQVSAVEGNTMDENNGWMRIKLCKGHNLDAVGVDFSHDDSLLCSCSLDKVCSVKIRSLDP